MTRLRLLGTNSDLGIDLDTGEIRVGGTEARWDELAAIPGRNVDLYTDWSGYGNGPPAQANTKQAFTSSYVGNSGAALTVSSGKLTNTYTGASSVAGYLTAAVRDGQPVKYIEGDLEFGAGSTDGTVMAMILWDSAFPSGLVSGGTKKAPCHFIVTPTYFSAQTYDSTNQNAQNLATLTTYTIPASTPKKVAIALDPDNNRMVVLCPDGRVRQYYDTARSLISTISAPYAQQEILYTDASTDKRGYWRNWRASTLAGKDADEYAAKWHWLIGQAPKRHHCALSSNYTLTSTTSVQKMFNASTNGQVTLPVGTYRFRTIYTLASMSATSGNSAFSFAGTATIANLMMFALGYDGAAGSANALSGAMAFTAVAVPLPASQHTAATSTNQQSWIEGGFRVTTAGTVIPSIALVTAAAALVGAGSFFECWEVGSENLGAFGQWD